MAPQRLYQRYLSTHFGAIHDISRAGLERERRVWRDYFRTLLPADRNARVLDLGCGYGSFLTFLAEEGYTNARGVDRCAEQVEAARRLGLANVMHGEAREALAGCSPVYDCITAIDLFEHLEKDELLDLLDAIWQALRPGGRLILRVPNAEGPLGTRILYSDFTHTLAFTPSSLRQVLTAAGFKSIELHPEGPRVHGLFSAARWLAWQAIRTLLELYLAVETGQWGGHLWTQNLIAVAQKPGESGKGG
ncbi:MAG: class I SAM-dependent methyltransferase [Firmicutes bacterium]|nr:class I SAM-dependent methyltransferase [Bacillota bacterium]